MHRTDNQLWKIEAYIDCLPFTSLLPWSHMFRVLVLERGGVAQPQSWPKKVSWPHSTHECNANTYDSPAQAFTSEDGVPNARGRVLGGSSAINAGFSSRADDDFFKRSGLPWDRKVVNESYDMTGLRGKLCVGQSWRLGNRRFEMGCSKQGLIPIK